jgi:acyl carrier protein
MHEELIAVIEDWSPSLQGTVDRRTPLLTSARLDSLGLFRLLLWIEQKVGHPINASTVDIVHEWDNVDAIVGFIEREAARR